MCGIAGIFDSTGGRKIDRELLISMNQRLEHRGPDDSGLHIVPGLGLAHRRLSIIDIGGGHQPMFNEDGSVCVVFNGEIYNFQELRAELRECGHEFQTNSDTEVLVHAWEEWRERCVDRFHGMFAFALWDSNLEALILVRDRLGIKPLFYSKSKDGFVYFSSEIQALFEVTGLTEKLRADAVVDYFSLGYVPDPKTIFDDVYKLPPGHYLIIRKGHRQLEPRQYWDLEFREDSTLSYEEGKGRLLSKLRDSVQQRLIADVPVGAFLSGGVDSSAVVAMASGLSERPVKTFSVGFAAQAFDESTYALQVSKRYSTEHQSFVVDAEDTNIIEKVASMYGEPFSDSSALPTFLVSEMTSRFVKVALSGDGGDENFGGYRRYSLHLTEELIRNALPASVRRPLFGALGAVYPKADWAPRYLRAKTTFQALGMNSADAYFHSVSNTSEDARKTIFKESFLRQLDGYRGIEVFRALQPEHVSDNPLAQVQYLDFRTWLPGDILTKVDRASMANSLEVRVPILDHRFVEFAATLPASYKIKSGAGKRILKDAMEPYLGHELLHRKKQGFSVPMDDWLRGVLRTRMLSLLERWGKDDFGIFDVDGVARLYKDHCEGIRLNGPLLWSCLVFDIFMKQEVAVR